MSMVEVTITAGQHSATVVVEVTDEEVEAYKLLHGRPANWGGMDPWERDASYDVAAKVAVQKVAEGED